MKFKGCGSHGTKVIELKQKWSTDRQTSAKQKASIIKCQQMGPYSSRELSSKLFHTKINSKIYIVQTCKFYSLLPMQMFNYHSFQNIKNLITLSASMNIYFVLWEFWNKLNYIFSPSFFIHFKHIFYLHLNIIMWYFLINCITSFYILYTTVTFKYVIHVSQHCWRN